MARTITCIDDVFQWLDEICDNEKYYDDNELSKLLNEVHYAINTGNTKYFITHSRIENVIRKRVKSYCESNKINMNDYNGVLPYRSISILKPEDILTTRKKRLNKIKKNLFFNKFKIWKNIVGKKK